MKSVKRKSKKTNKGYQEINISPDALEVEKLRHQTNKPMGVAYMVGRLERALRRQLREVLEPKGLTLSQYTALSVFNQSARPSSAQLTKRIKVSPQAANVLIKSLEKNGWIARKPDPNHGRTLNINLTKEGKQLLVSCDKLIAKLEREMLKELSDTQIVTLHSQWRTLMESLTDS